MASRGPNHAMAPLRPRPQRSSPRRVSSNPRQIERGLHVPRYKKPQPERRWDEDDVWKQVCETPPPHGREGKGPHAGYERRLKAFYRLLLLIADEENPRTDAFSVARWQLIARLYPQSGKLTMREMELRHGGSITNWSNALNAAGVTYIAGIQDGRPGRTFSRTDVELLAPGEAETLEQGTPILNSPSEHPADGGQQQLLEASEGPSPAAVQQLVEGTFRQAADAPGFSRFSSVFPNPCRDNSNVLGPTVQNVAKGPDVEDVRARAREGSTQQIDGVGNRTIAAPGPAERMGWEGGQVPDFARQRLEALVAEAQADPARAVALSFPAFQLVFERRPLTLSRGFARLLRRALACCDRWRWSDGARAGAGFEELVGMMVAHRIRLEGPPSQAQLRGFQHPRQWPRSPAYFAVPLRKRARQWRREHDPDRRRRSRAFRAARPASYQTGPRNTQERRKGKRPPPRRTGRK